MSQVLQELLERQALERPENIAIECGDDRISYKMLNERAECIAKFLQANKIGPGSYIGIEAEKSIFSISALWGVLKAGATFVPIDTKISYDRLRHVLRNCPMQGFVCEMASESTAYKIGALTNPHCVMLCKTGPIPFDVSGLLLDELPECSAESDRSLNSSATDIAYVLHTSGSTGIPKGVALSHRAALAFIDWVVEAMHVSRVSRVLSTAPLFFDLSTFDIFASAATGATCVLVPPHLLIFPENLNKYITDKAISHLYTVPFLLRQLAKYSTIGTRPVPALQQIMFAGEPMPLSILKDLRDKLPSVNFHNLYGPTESNVCTSYSLLAGSEKIFDELPIGSPAAGAAIYVIDDNLREVSDGQRGQLAISGPSLMEGYIGQPLETAKRMSTVRTTAHGDLSRVYLSGDIVERRADGLLYYFGRVDNQIKRKGYRIELGEISAVLDDVAQLAENAVISIPDNVTSAKIIAFVVFISDEVGLDELAALVSQRLPAYMIPDIYIPVQALYRNATAKIDTERMKQLYLTTVKA